MKPWLDTGLNAVKPSGSSKGYSEWAPGEKISNAEVNFVEAWLSGVGSRVCTDFGKMPLWNPLRTN
jgi:hypothetical protein